MIMSRFTSNSYVHSDNKGENSDSSEAAKATLWECVHTETLEKNVAIVSKMIPASTDNCLTSANSNNDKQVDKNMDIYLSMDTLRVELRCPICLDILTKTMCVKECIHRFCKKCLDRALKTNGKYCPVCYTSVATRQHTRRDISLDNLISYLFHRTKKQPKIASETPNKHDETFLLLPCLSPLQKTTGHITKE
ncbi:hypothetical protein RFI_14407 [Reticulomyxa filosa]|uniref:RING-type E3 ubiquitin transferase n=1 Tax=Reticulomyxa filosa TaxID=46433 RepID=X6NBT8_RETFI|nr:hypothetical protein RFI_14407 [Reticulomyxa filosa]|eukprot:ETO22787.1 hypothetical protein RFI_14407 [Reticulomyxa filosa]